MNLSLGRLAFALAAIGFGVCALVSHDFVGWQQIKAFGGGPYRDVFVDIVALVQILGGVAMMWPKTARRGAIALGAIYLCFVLLAVPSIVEHPLVYNGYGNFFEQLSFVAGAMMLSARWARIGYYAFGVCVISFGLEQLVYLSQTADFVPKWIPPGQMFWAIATTVAFGLGALALLTGFQARLAARLTAAMVAGFGLLVWLPALIADPRSAASWSESVETFGIAATSWIVVDLLGRWGARAEETNRR